MCAIICAMYRPKLKSFEVQHKCVEAPRGRTGGRRLAAGVVGVKHGELPATRFPVNQRGFMETGPHGSRAGHVRKEARVAALCCLKDFFPFISAAQEGSCSLRFSSRRCWLLIPCLLLFFIFLSSCSPSVLAFSPSKTISHVFIFSVAHTEFGNRLHCISLSVYHTHTHFPSGSEAGIAVLGQVHCSALPC